MTRIVQMPQLVAATSEIIMFEEPDFSEDLEFSRLLLRDRDVDLTVVALEIARDANPQLTFEPTLQWIADRGDELQGRLAATWSDADALRALSSLLAETHGLKGNDAAYHEAAGSFLPDVIARRQGIPISLSVLYMAVARAAGLDLAGVATPQHFLTRLQSIEGPLFVDAYHEGRVMDKSETLLFLNEVTGMPESELKPSLKSCDTRTIVVRMLNNLKVLYAKQEDWHAAWPVQLRLLALKPSCYDERRDLALVALKAERTQDAVDLLEDCLAECPTSQHEFLEQHLQQARRQFAKWN